MRVVFAGTPEFAAVSLEAILDAGHDVALVLTQPDRPAGRGRQPQPSAVRRTAASRGLPVAQPVSLTDSIVEQVEEILPEVLVVVAYGLLLPPTLLRAPAWCCLNVHASLLPRWRGAAPIQRALLAGDAETGISIMQMDEGLDTGPILAQARIAIASQDTAGSLHDRLAALGAVLLVDTLEKRPPARPQRVDGVTYAKKITRAESWIDWTGHAADIERQVRALEPVPGAQSQLGEVVLKIRKAELASGVAADAGEILSADSSGIVVACGQGCVRILELQRPGGRRLPTREFLAGFRIAAGARWRSGDA